MLNRSVTGCLKSRLLSAVCLLFLNSCFTFQPVEITGVEAVRISKLSAEGIEAEVMLKIKNPNGFKFTITGYDLDIRLQNLELGKARLKNEVVVKAESEQAYPFHVQAGFGKMLLAAIPVFLSLQQKNTADVGVKGYVRVKAWGIGRKIEVDLNEHIGLVK